MAAKPGMFGQITEEFEQIGKQIAQETIKVPKDVVGSALESLGAGGGKKPKGQTAATPAQPAPEPGSQAEADAQQAMEIKRAIARAALAELAGGKPAQKEPSVWEKQQQEEQQKKEQKKLQAEAERKANVPQTSSKRKRGDLYGMKAKKQGSELSKNVKHD
jgi:hypothetical protein